MCVKNVRNNNLRYGMNKKLIDKQCEEKEVEGYLRTEVEKIGGKAFKLSSQIEAGMPDRLVCLPGGRVLFVETKRPKGGKVSKIQLYRMKQLKDLGFNVEVINTRDKVRELIEKEQDDEV